jgi:GT2 family glycosyltransferase
VLNLLKLLNNMSYPKEATDVLVVYNHSNDHTAEAISKNYPPVTLIVNSTNLGGTGGFNTGLRWAFEQHESTYKYYWLLDNESRKWTLIRNTHSCSHGR